MFSLLILQSRKKRPIVLVGTDLIHVYLPINWQIFPGKCICCFDFERGEIFFFKRFFTLRLTMPIPN